MGEQGLKNSEKGHRVLLRRGPFSLTLLCTPSVEQALKAGQKASSFFPTQAKA